MPRLGSYRTSAATFVLRAAAPMATFAPNECPQTETSSPISAAMWSMTVARSSKSRSRDQLPVSPLAPKPRRSIEYVVKSPTSSSTSVRFAVWSCSEPWTSTSGGPAPSTQTASWSPSLAVSSMQVSVVLVMIDPRLVSGFGSIIGPNTGPRMGRSPHHSTAALERSPDSSANRVAPARVRTLALA